MMGMDTARRSGDGTACASAMTTKATPGCRPGRMAVRRSQSSGERGDKNRACPRHRQVRSMRRRRGSIFIARGRRQLTIFRYSLLTRYPPTIISLPDNVTERVNDMGRKPIAGKAMSGAERVRKHRQKRQEAWRPSRSRDAERFRNWLEQSKPEDIAAFAGLSLQANVTQTAEPLHADVTELKRRLAESEAENARLKAATGGAEPLQAEVTELRRRLEECEVSRDQARAECSSASQMVAYFEGAQSGVFNKKTFNLI